MLEREAVGAPQLCGTTAGEPTSHLGSIQPVSLPLPFRIPTVSESPMQDPEENVDFKEEARGLPSAESSHAALPFPKVTDSSSPPPDPFLAFPGVMFSCH